jgi:hypothetical protein
VRTGRRLRVVAKRFHRRIVGQWGRWDVRVERLRIELDRPHRHLEWHRLERELEPRFELFGIDELGLDLNGHRVGLDRFDVDRIELGFELSQLDLDLRFGLLQLRVGIEHHVEQLFDGE